LDGWGSISNDERSSGVRYNRDNLTFFARTIIIPQVRLPPRSWEFLNQIA
jgi:hypothetical protein